MSSHDQPWPPNGGQQPGPYGGQPPYAGNGPLPPGYPQQPGPYPQQSGGYQPAPGYRPQFGGQPGYGAPPPKKRKPWFWLVPLVVVVVAAAITVPIVLSQGGSSGGSSASGQGKSPLASWQVPVSKTGFFGDGFGAWAYADELITVTATAVTAYGRADGASRWKLAPPLPNTAFCSASRNIADDRIAVAYGATSPDDASDKVCVNIGLVNLKTGKFVWSGKYVESSALPPPGIAMIIAGNSLFAGFGEADFEIQVDLVTGKIKSNAQVEDGTDASSAICSVDDIAATSTTVYYLFDCQPDGGSGSTPNYSHFDAVRAQDVATGQLTGYGSITAQAAELPQDPSMPQGVDPGEFISASPMVVAVAASGVNTDFHNSFVGLDSSLKVTWAQVGTSGDPGQLDGIGASDGLYGWTGFGRAFVANGVLFTETTFEGPAGNFNNRVVAIDATSGQQKWATGMANVGFACPVSVQGQTVTAVGQTLGAATNPDVVLANFDVNSGKLVSSQKQNIKVYANGTTLPSVLDLRSVWFVAADNRVYGADLSAANNELPPTPEVFSVG